MVDEVTSEIPDEALATPSRIRLQYRSLFDHATGLPGWPVLIDRTRMALARAAQNDLRVAVMVFDDVRRGSSISADFTTCVAALRDAVFADDTVARIGGRTFVVLLNDVRRAETLASTANEMVDGLGISCHIGIALGSPPCDPEEVINQARRDALPAPPPPAPRWEEQYRHATPA